MESKQERLRRGEVVDLKEGIRGRLDFKDRTLELEGGRKLPLSQKDQKELFPESEEDLAYTREKEKIRAKTEKIPFGKALHSMTQSGAAYGIKDLARRFLKGLSPEEYQRRKKADVEVASEIEESDPLASNIGKGLSLAPDLAITSLGKGAITLPALTGLSAGSRIVDEPLQVGAEMGVSAIAGKALDMGSKWLATAANRRAASRALPRQQSIIEQDNRSLMESYNKQLADRKNLMIQAQNEFKQANAARDAEILRLKNADAATKSARQGELARLEAESKKLAQDYKVAQQEYAKAVEEVPRLQKEAQAVASKKSVQHAENIQKSFPKNSKIHLAELGAKEFLEDTLVQRGLAGTSQGNAARKILTSLFPEGEVIAANQLAKRYEGLESAIQRSTPEVRDVLSSFKMHLGERIPRILEDTIAFQKILPGLEKTLTQRINYLVAKMNLTTPGIKNNLLTSAKNALREISPNNFIARLKNGEIAQEILQKVGNAEHFLPEGVLGATPVFGAGSKAKFKEGFNNALLDHLRRGAEASSSQFSTHLLADLNHQILKSSAKAIESAQAASKKIKPDLKGTVGRPQNVPSPQAPTPPPFPSMDLPEVSTSPLPPPITPPSALPFPRKPSLRPAPTLPPAEGMAEQAGDFLEKKLLGGKGIVNNPLTKLAGLKYLLGKAALPVEAAYLGAKALTSPTAGGEMARMAFKQGGIQAVESWLQKYPSYHDGILENPQERRSVTKEIENDPDIPIEQKAIMQSKINRGKPLKSPL